MKTFILVTFMLLLGLTEPMNRTYHRTYHENGNLASEGWLRFNVKDGYWKYYHENGRLSEQGYYQYNKRERYWYFYN